MATAQDHINRIGEALINVEEKAKASKQAAKDVIQSVRHLHGLLDKAQAAYSASVSDEITLFSGGTDKPDPDAEVPPTKP